MHMRSEQLQKTPTVPPVCVMFFSMSFLRDCRSVLAVDAPEKPGIDRRTWRPGS